MITITPEAAAQIRHSAKEGRMEGMALRVAAQRNPDGSIHYGIGFDDESRDGDNHFKSEGIDIVVSPVSLDLVAGMTIDFVELDDGNREFVFLNPNDPNYTPPAE